MPRQSIIGYLAGSSCSFLRFDQFVEACKGVVAKRRLAVQFAGNRAVVSSRAVLLVLFIVAIQAEKFPVAAVGGIVGVVVVLMVDGQFAQRLTGKLPPAACTHVGKHGEGLVAVTGLTQCLFALSFCDPLGLLFGIQGFAGRSHFLTDLP